MSENETFKVFQKIYDWLKSEGTISTDLDYKFAQTALSEKQKVTAFFEAIIDQPAFLTEDHKRIREFLINWYATHRSQVTKTRQVTDAFNLDTESLNEVIKGMGFPFPDRIGTNETKAQFLLDLVSLYQKKGTPEVLVKSLQTYFGLTDVVLSEWWVHKQTDDLIVAKSRPVYPTTKKGQRELYITSDIDIFTSTDPLWKMSGAEILELYQINKISLPSITPYVSLQAGVNVSSLNAFFSVITKRMNEDYDYWVANGTLVKDITLTKFEGQFSFLEVSLAIHYLFGNDNFSTDKNFLQYTGQYAPIDPDGTGNNNIDVNLIIDEWNNLTTRQTTKLERETNLASRNSSFTNTTTNSSIFINILKNPDIYLDLINPIFKAEIDEVTGNLDPEKVPTVLESIILDYEFYLKESMPLLNNALSFMMVGSPTWDGLDDVMEVLKPYRVRLKEFLISFVWNDPLADSQLEADEFSMAQTVLFVDKHPTHPFDTGIVYDSFSVEIINL